MNTDAQNTLPSGLNPGIAATVAWLRSHGFKTTDSGDGKTHDHGCDLPIPYVHMTVYPWRMVMEADRLADLLRRQHGIVFKPMDDEVSRPLIQATYSPNDESALGIISLYNVCLPEQPELVQAAAPAGGEEIKARISLSLPTLGADNALPADIQWMPPGMHTISASVNGKPGTRKVNVTAKAAEMAQAALTANLVAVEAGTEDRFYFDLNHEDREASAHPTEFFWAGDDPKTGGVRAKLEWTSAGAAAVQGRTFRRFSPSFYLDAAGEVTGVPVNAGGLVNRAAFKKIQPVTAKEEPNPSESNTMNKLTLILASLGIIKKQDADEDTIVSEVQAFAAANRTALEEGVKAKGDFTALKTNYDTLVKAHATSVVDQAIAEGKLPPKDETLKAKWIEQIVANPDSEQLLASLQPNPALKTLVKAGGPSESGALPNGEQEHPFVVKAKAVGAERKVSLDFAYGIVAGDEPKLYDEYRQSLFEK